MTALFSSGLLLGDRNKLNLDAQGDAESEQNLMPSSPPSLNAKGDDGILFIYYCFPGDPEAVQEQALKPQKNCLHRENCHSACISDIKHGITNTALASGEAWNSYFSFRCCISKILLQCQVILSPPFFSSTKQGARLSCTTVPNNPEHHGEITKLSVFPEVPLAQGCFTEGQCRQTWNSNPCPLHQLNLSICKLPGTQTASVTTNT